MAEYEFHTEADHFAKYDYFVETNERFAQIPTKPASLWTIICLALAIYVLIQQNNRFNRGPNVLRVRSR